MRAPAPAWHWFFHQVPDLPEALTAGREEIYLRHMYKAWAYNPAAIEEEAVQEYLRCFRQPGAMRAGFETTRGGDDRPRARPRRPRHEDHGADARALGRGAEPAGRRYAGRLEGAVRVHGRRPRRAGLGPLHPEEQPQAVVDSVLEFAGEEA